MIDVVYPYYEAGSGWNGNELRFSLRSLEKHLKEDFRVWVVGDLPVWASDEVRHIPFVRKTLADGPNFNNSSDIHAKIALACRYVSDFLVIADDQYFLQDLNSSFFTHPFYLEDLIKRPKRMTKWQKRLWDTKDQLTQLGLPTLNAECHTPFLVNAKKFLEIFKLFKLSEGRSLWKTVYLNYHFLSNEVKKVPKRAIAFSYAEAEIGIQDVYKDAFFLCYNNRGLTTELKTFIMTHFNKPSRFEKFSPSTSKIFSIGMPKTGTTSLTFALQELGYKVKRYPHNPLSIGQVDAATDIPVANNFKELDEAYPKAKFIFTVRDNSSWLPSSIEQFKTVNKNKFALSQRKIMFGAEFPTEEQLLSGKETHEKRVLEYFKDRPEDLLILDIFAGEGYPELTQFLNLPLYDCQFPHENKRKEQLI